MRLRRRERQLFLTHTPGPWCEPGTVHHVAAEDGAAFVVTRIVPLAPTMLITGGVQPCWRVMAKPHHA